MSKLSAKEYLRSVTQYNGRFHIDEVCAHMEAYHAAAMAELRKEIEKMPITDYGEFDVPDGKDAHVYRSEVLAILDKHMKP